MHLLVYDSCFRGVKILTHAYVRQIEHVFSRKLRNRPKDRNITVYVKMKTLESIKLNERKKKANTKHISLKSNLNKMGKAFKTYLSSAQEDIASVYFCS